MSGPNALSLAGLRWRTGQFDVEDMLVVKANGCSLSSLSAPPSALLRCLNITTLELRRNEIRTLDGIEVLSALRRLDLTDNKVATLAPLSMLTKLEEVFLAQNAISDVKQLDHLKDLADLRTLSLGPGRGNVIAAGDRHFPIVLDVLPQVRILDGQSTAVIKAQRSAAAAMVKAAQPPRLPAEGPWLATSGDSSSRGRTADTPAAGDAGAAASGAGAGGTAALAAAAAPEAMPMTTALRAALGEAAAAAATASAQLADRKL